MRLGNVSVLLVTVSLFLGHRMDANIDTCVWDELQKECKVGKEWKHHDRQGCVTGWNSQSLGLSPKPLFSACYLCRCTLSREGLVKNIHLEDIINYDLSNIKFSPSHFTVSAIFLHLIWWTAPPMVHIERSIKPCTTCIQHWSWTDIEPLGLYQFNPDTDGGYWMPTKKASCGGRPERRGTLFCSLPCLCG